MISWSFLVRFVKYFISKPHVTIEWSTRGFENTHFIERINKGDYACFRQSYIFAELLRHFTRFGKDMTIEIVFFNSYYIYVGIVIVVSYERYASMTEALSSSRK